jgi:hypothetical protein
MDMESMQLMIKCLSNEIIYMKINTREGNLNQTPYKPLFRRPISPKPIKPPFANLNLDLEGVAMDNFSNYHQANHSEKNLSSMDK